MTEKDDLENLSGAFALDAVSPEERAAVERALAGSESLRAEAGELADTAAALADAVQPVRPSAGLKDAIFAQLDATPQLPREQAAPDAVVPPAQPVQPDPVGPAEARARTRWFRRPAVVVTGIAAAAALIVGGITVPVLLAGTTQQQDDFAAIAAASDAQRSTADVVGGGTATVVWSGELGRAAIELDGAAPLDDASDYELWFIGADGPRSAGVVKVDASGDARQELAGDMAAGDAIGLTVEPAGGSEQPTTDPVLVVATA